MSDERLQKIRDEAHGALNCGFQQWEDEWQILAHSALNNILKLCDTPPVAFAPGKHEPEPIAPPFGRNKPPARARKRA